MTKANEKLIKAKIKKALEEVGAYIVMPQGGMYGRAGVPDFLVCLPSGKFVGIEAKWDATKNPPTKLQLINLRDIRSKGGLSMVVDKNNIESFPFFIERMDGVHTITKELWDQFDYEQYVTEN